ncbi:hypothetical protein IWW36_003179, partial [Coemansia brasiliensis]
RTALDDWESLLYVVCWLATFGIRSEDRRSLDENLSISLWDTNEVDAAKAKRGHMDDSRVFEDDIANKFQPHYKLLKGLAIGLHRRLFLHPGCEGARFGLATDEEIPLLDSEDTGSLPKTDPLVERSKHVNAIVTNLVDFLYFKQ